MKSPARCLIPFAAMLGVLTCSPSLAGEAEYQLVIIEPWNTSYSLAVSRVDGLNNLNRVTGCASTQPLGGPCSFIWTLDTGKVEIDLAGPINDSGVIVATNIIRWPDGTFQELDGAISGAADINDSNVVAGSNGSVFTCPQPPPFVNREATVWTADTGTIRLEQDLGVPSADQAWAINNLNVVVGVRSSTGHCGDQKAFYYDLDNEQYIDLHAILTGSPSGITHAVDINDAGSVVGDGPTTMGGSAFLWNQSDGVTILPDLPGTLFGYSIPSSINNHGSVVGQAIVDDWRAWIWTADTGIRDLNDITTGIPDNFAIVEAKKINDNGWIIGRGQYGTWSPERAVVLIPIAPPMRADLNGDCTVDLADLNLVLANFGTDSTEADTNDDGTVDLADLNAVLADFGQSCP
ncbi:MAG: DUF3466 family protein [bacterium]|nr:DUF3466 family protein [bacterium]